MQYRTETLWEGQRFAIRRELDGFAAGKLYIEDMETGRVDWPIQYKDGRVAFDNPHRLPGWIQETAKILYSEDTPLRAVRLQLATLVDYLQNIEDPRGPHWDETLAYELPYYISEYDPEDWADPPAYSQDANQCNRPIYLAYEHAVAAIRAMGLDDAADKAEELPIGDLLAWSEEANTPS